MTTKQNSSLGIVFILGLLAMLMPLSIDMYLPALPVISSQFNVPDGSAQMTLSTYILGFALGQLLYGPMADSIGRKPVILGGTLIFAAAAVACALSQTIEMLITMRFFHGLAAAAASVVINALMRDIYPKEEFSRMMSFVMLVTTIAPLVAPMVGGAVLVWFSWHAIFWILALAALLAEPDNLQAAFVAAQAGADRTCQSSKAGAGRASYLNSESLLGNMDPGAHAVAMVFKALAER